MQRMKNKVLAAPYIVWMALFIIVPLGIVVYYALTDSITGQFTLANLSGMGTYLPIFLRSIWLSLFASLICLLIGYPVAYFIAQCKPTTQRFLEMLIMLPMCMSFLLRTLAWVGMLEDTGIVMGQAFAQALGDKRGIRRFGDIAMPMDEALILAAVDISGRGQLFWEADVPAVMVGSFDATLAKEFFIAFAANAGVTLHIRELAGENTHHVIEGMFKAVARAMRQAVEPDPRMGDALPTTKGAL